MNGRSLALHALVGGVALVAGYTLRPLFVPARDAAPDVAMTAAATTGAGPLLVARPPSALPLDRQDDLQRSTVQRAAVDQRALVSRTALLEQPEAARSTNLIAADLATKVLLRLMTIHDGESMRACLARVHGGDVPERVRLELDLRSTAGGVELLGVRIVDPPLDAEGTCIRSRLVGELVEPRAAYMPPLLEGEGSWPEELPLPAD